MQAATDNTCLKHVQKQTQAFGCAAQDLAFSVAPKMAVNLEQSCILPNLCKQIMEKLEEHHTACMLFLQLIHYLLAQNNIQAVSLRHMTRVRYNRLRMTS